MSDEVIGGDHYDDGRGPYLLRELEAGVLLTNGAPPADNVQTTPIPLPTNRHGIFPTEISHSARRTMITIFHK
ncbi:hypothetical protein CEXT_434671 [Caerostris extrusa]|uniref:Uncharacterized protein n=1 Tax=Caerostris extrusa TaxID=172846 RepID=A0AAV4XIN6_CAEEX|nr:hypothetical protein CEXT_434671 [Caerostris extrusa]